MTDRSFLIGVIYVNAYTNLLQQDLAIYQKPLRSFVYGAL